MTMTYDTLTYYIAPQRRTVAEVRAAVGLAEIHLGGIDKPMLTQSPWHAEQRAQQRGGAGA